MSKLISLIYLATLITTTSCSEHESEQIIEETVPFKIIGTWHKVREMFIYNQYSVFNSGKNSFEVFSYDLTVQNTDDPRTFEEFSRPLDYIYWFTDDSIKTYQYPEYRDFSSDYTISGDSLFYKYEKFRIGFNGDSLVLNHTYDNVSIYEFYVRKEVDKNKLHFLDSVIVDWSYFLRKWDFCHNTLQKSTTFEGCGWQQVTVPEEVDLSVSNKGNYTLSKNLITLNYKGKKYKIEMLSKNVHFITLGVYCIEGSSCSEIISYVDEDYIDYSGDDALNKSENEPELKINLKGLFEVLDDEMNDNK